MELISKLTCLVFMSPVSPVFHTKEAVSIGLKNKLRNIEIKHKPCISWDLSKHLRHDIKCANVSPFSGDL